MTRARALALALALGGAGATVAALLLAGWLAPDNVLAWWTLAAFCG